MTILLFDIGGSSIKYGVWKRLKLRDTGSVKTPASWEGMKVLLSDIFNKLNVKYDFEGVSISVPGNADFKKGIIFGVSAIPYIHNFYILGEFHEIFSLPVCIENDANCAGLGEALLGAGKDYNSVIFLIAGSGVGGSIIKNKQLYRGAHNYAGEFGLMLLDQYKTFSTLATPVAMARRYNQRMGREDNPLSGEEVFKLSTTGDTVAIDEVSSFYKWMAVGLINIQVCYDPDCLIIGGGISRNNEIFANIKSELSNIIMTHRLEEFMPNLKISDFRGDSNLIGAAVRFDQEFNMSLFSY
ncbi:TPA: ROK family protein [Klebsiella aerogenes]|nr:ROK family protein [Klebsiella aerogenes]